MYVFGNRQATAKPAPLTTAFALLTDLTQFLPAPAGHPHAQFPGIFLSVDETFAKMTDAAQAGLLLNGSQPGPTAVFALNFSGQCFAVLANPLDAMLRPDMEKQRQGRQLPMLVAMNDGNFVRVCPPIPAWETALTDTEGRPSVDPLSWLASTEDIVAALPEILATNPGFRNCKRYHVYFVVPDNASHPLYDRVS